MSFNVNTTHPSKSLCLGSDWSRYVPAEVSSKLDTSLRYTVCYANTLKEAYTKQVLNRIDYDNGSPAINMIINPIWSTWAELKDNMNQSVVLEYARNIAVKY